MELPSQNPSGYEYSSVMQHVHNLKGRLLLVHGMIDENVHFKHTAWLVNELLIFPDDRHMSRRHEDRVYIIITSKYELMRMNIGGMIGRCSFLTRSSPCCLLLFNNFNFQFFIILYW